MRLRTTFVGLLVVVALVLSGTILVGFTMHKNQVLAQERGEVERTAAIVAERIDTKLHSAVDTVDLWSTRTPIGEGSRQNTLVALRTFVERTTFDRAEVYDSAGTLQYTYGSSPAFEEAQRAVGEGYSAAPFFERALAGESYISRPHPSVSEGYIVQITTPITDSKGDVVGIFSGTFEIGNGSLLASVENLGASPDRVTVTTEQYTLFDEGSPDGSYLTASTNASRVDWTVSVSRPRSAFADRLRAATALQIGGVAVALLTVAVVGVWISRTTFARIRTLLGAFADLESGEYRTDLDLGKIEEWQRISERFNSLSRTLEQRDSQLRVLNRVLRHNLRNDMNVVTSHAERILAEADVSDDVKADVEKIHTTAHRLLSTSEHARTLYDDLLAKPKQALEPVDVVPIVESRVARLSSQFPEATIETDLPSMAYGLDSKTLPIVVEELLRNALVHNDLPEARRRVDVSVTRTETTRGDVDASGAVRIDIEDNGPGIPMVEEALLTEQLEETSIDHGSGLGVWLVNWLLDQIGGTVTARTGVDRGTTVSIHVPAPDSSSDSVDGGGEEEIPNDGDDVETEVLRV